MVGAPAEELASRLLALRGFDLLDLLAGPLGVVDLEAELLSLEAPADALAADLDVVVILLRRNHLVPDHHRLGWRADPQLTLAQSEPELVRLGSVEEGVQVRFDRLAQNIDLRLESGQ